MGKNARRLAMETFLTRRRNVAALAVFCCALWGSATPVIKIGYRLFAIRGGALGDLFLFAGVRFALSGVLTILIGSLGQRRFLRPKRDCWGMVTVLCLFQTIMQYICYYVGLQHITAVKGSILNTLGVFLCLVVSALAFRQERFTARKVVGCLIGFGGVVLVNLTPGAFSGAVTLLGEGMIFLSALAYAISSCLIKAFSRREDPVTLSGYQFLLGGSILAALGLCLGGELSPQSPAAFAALGYLAFLSAAAYSVWGLLLRHNPVSSVAVFGFLNPIIGVILSALLLREQQSASWGQCAAALAMVSIGIITINRPETKKL